MHSPLGHPNRGIFHKPDIRLNTRAGRRPAPAARTLPSGPVPPPGAAVPTGLIAPVIPLATRPSRGRRGTPSRAPSPLPLADSPPGAQAAREEVVYGIGRIDASGRVADRAVIGVLGWCGGDRLTLTAEAGVVIARRDPGGMVAVPARSRIMIPAALRRRCGLRAGDPVLLAAIPGRDALAAYSFAVVDQAIRAHGALPGGEGGQP